VSKPFCVNERPGSKEDEHDTSGLRKERTGLIVSDRMQKTVVVSIDGRSCTRGIKNPATPLQSEGARREQSCHVGDRVLIVECRPLSRDKRWRVSKVLERGHATTREESKEPTPRCRSWKDVEVDP